MSESIKGELYKKLAIKADEVSSFIASEKGVTDILDGRDNPYLDGMVWDDLKKVLDEARADMPKSYTEESKTDTVTLASGKVMPALYVHSPEVEDWEKWARRWFGTGAP